jgi:hypothetical protein
MGDTALVLDGYRLPTDDGRPIRSGQRFTTRRARRCNRINELIDRLERRRA